MDDASSETQIDKELNDELVADWIKKVKKEKKTDNFSYEEHLGKALEAGDPTATDFIRKAKRLDPKFVKTHFPNFEEADKKG